MISNDKVRRMATTQSNRRGKRKRRNRLNQCLFPIESVSTTSSPCALHVQSNMAGKRKRPLAAKCSAPHRNLHRHREIPLAKREPGESERNPGPEAERSAKGKERGSRVHNISLSLVSARFMKICKAQQFIQQQRHHQ